MDEWLETNRVMWDERAAPHAASPDYDVERLVADPDLLSDVVRFDLPRLGDLTGLRVLHLQCHIGTDTLSLHRLGAQVTGLDFSPASIEQARLLASRAGAEIDFVVASVDEATTALPVGTFDVVFTGVGALLWLPDLAAWARTVARLLRPGGRLFLRDGHPMLSALESRGLPGLDLRYPYFERPEPTVWDEPGTYVATEHDFTHTRSVEFSHSLGEIVSAVLAAGLRLTMLVEHDSVPWDALPGQMAVTDDGEFRLISEPWRLAASYTLQAVRDDPTGTSPGR